MDPVAVDSTPTGDLHIGGRGDLDVGALRDGIGGSEFEGQVDEVEGEVVVLGELSVGEGARVGVGEGDGGCVGVFVDEEAVGVMEDEEVHGGGSEGDGVLEGGDGEGEDAVGGDGAGGEGGEGCCYFLF